MNLGEDQEEEDQQTIRTEDAEAWVETLSLDGFTINTRSTYQSTATAATSTTRHKKSNNSSSSSRMEPLDEEEEDGMEARPLHETELDEEEELREYPPSQRPKRSGGTSSAHNTGRRSSRSLSTRRRKRFPLLSTITTTTKKKPVRDLSEILASREEKRKEKSAKTKSSSTTNSSSSKNKSNSSTRSKSGRSSSSTRPKPQDFSQMVLLSSSADHEQAVPDAVDVDIDHHNHNRPAAADESLVQELQPTTSPQPRSTTTSSSPKHKTKHNNNPNNKQEPQHFDFSDLLVLPNVAATTSDVTMKQRRPSNATTPTQIEHQYQYQPQQHPQNPKPLSPSSNTQHSEKEKIFAAKPPMSPTSTRKKKQHSTTNSSSVSLTDYYQGHSQQQQQQQQQQVHRSRPRANSEDMILQHYDFLNQPNMNNYQNDDNVDEVFVSSHGAGNNNEEEEEVMQHTTTEPETTSTVPTPTPRKRKSTSKNTNTKKKGTTSTTSSVASSSSSKSKSTTPAFSSSSQKAIPDKVTTPVPTSHHEHTHNNNNNHNSKRHDSTINYISSSSSSTRSRRQEMQAATATTTTTTSSPKQRTSRDEKRPVLEKLDITEEPQIETTTEAVLSPFRQWTDSLAALLPSGGEVVTPPSTKAAAQKNTTRETKQTTDTRPTPLTKSPKSSLEQTHESTHTRNESNVDTHGNNRAAAAAVVKQQKHNATAINDSTHGAKPKPSIRPLPSTGSWSTCLEEAEEAKVDRPNGIVSTKSNISTRGSNASETESASPVATTNNNPLVTLNMHQASSIVTRHKTAAELIEERRRESAKIREESVRRRQQRTTGRAALSERPWAQRRSQQQQRWTVLNSSSHSKSARTERWTEDIADDKNSTKESTVLRPSPSSRPDPPMVQSSKNYMVKQPAQQQTQKPKSKSSMDTSNQDQVIVSQQPDQAADIPKYPADRRKSQNNAVGESSEATPMPPQKNPIIPDIEIIDLTAPEEDRDTGEGALKRDVAPIHSDGGNQQMSRNPESVSSQQNTEHRERPAYQTHSNNQRDDPQEVICLIDREEDVVVGHALPSKWASSRFDSNKEFSRSIHMPTSSAVASPFQVDLTSAKQDSSARPQRLPDNNDQQQESTAATPNDKPDDTSSIAIVDIVSDDDETDVQVVSRSSYDWRDQPMSSNQIAALDLGISETGTEEAGTLGSLYQKRLTLKNKEAQIKSFLSADWGDVHKSTKSLVPDTHANQENSLDTLDKTKQMLYDQTARFPPPYFDIDTDQSASTADAARAGKEEEFDVEANQPASPVVDAKTDTHFRRKDFIQAPNAPPEAEEDLGTQSSSESQTESPPLPADGLSLPTSAQEDKTNRLDDLESNSMSSQESQREGEPFQQEFNFESRDGGQADKPSSSQLNNSEGDSQRLFFAENQEVDEAWRLGIEAQDADLPPLHAALYRGASLAELYELASQAKKEPSTLRERDNLGNTIMHIACLVPSKQPTPSTLINTNASKSPKQKDPARNHPYYQTDSLLLVIQLLYNLYPKNIEKINTAGQLPLHLAVISAAACSNRNATSHNTTTTESSTPKIWLDVIEKMIIEYPKALHVPDRNGQVPLDLAMHKMPACPEIVKLIQEEIELLSEEDSDYSGTGDTESQTRDGESQTRDGESQTRDGESTSSYDNSIVHQHKFRSAGNADIPAETVGREGNEAGGEEEPSEMSEIFDDEDVELGRMGKISNRAPSKASPLLIEQEEREWDERLVGLSNYPNRANYYNLLGCCRKLNNKAVLAVALVMLTVAGMMFSPQSVTHRPINVAFIGNSITFVNDLPRFMEALSGGYIFQNSCLHGASRLRTILNRGNGMYNKWNTNTSILLDVNEDDDLYIMSKPDDDESANNLDVIYDYGACTVRQLLFGFDDNLVAYNENGYYRDDGKNPCFREPMYITYQRFQYREFAEAQRLEQKQEEHPESVLQLWDYVVLNDQTLVPAVSDERELSEQVLKYTYAPYFKQIQARPVLLMTHAYSRNASVSFDDSLDYIWTDVPTFTTALYSGYKRYEKVLTQALPSELAPRFAPAGLAFLMIYEENLDMWERLFFVDGFHPSPHGTFLIGCVLYATLYDRMPANIPSNVEDLWAMARKMQIGNDNIMPFPTQDEAIYLANIAERVALKKQMPSSLLEEVPSS